MHPEIQRARHNITEARAYERAAQQSLADGEAILADEYRFRARYAWAHAVHLLAMALLGA